MKRCGIRPLALIVMAIFLAGCSQGPTITVLPPSENAGLYAVEPTVAPVEISPESDAEDYSGFYAPAPANLWDAPVEDASTQPSTQMGNNSGAVTTLRGVDLVVGLVVGEQAVLHPLRTQYVDLLNMNALVFEGLVAYDDAMKPTPMLADRWSVSGNEWTFTLREGVSFHDGTKLSAADVVASYNDARNYPETEWYPLLQNIDSMVEIDERTVGVRAKSDLGYMLLYAMTFPVVQRSSIDNALAVGTGPYRYVSYHTSQSVVLETNPLWWRKSSDGIHSIVGVCYPNTKQALEALEAGDIDALATRNHAVALSRNLKDRVTFDYSTMRYECVIPNLGDPLLQDRRLREALVYAIDRQSLGRTAYANMVQESEVPVVPGTFLYDAQATKYNYSPERALQILYDAGWADLNGDGILEKEVNGILVDLKLSLITYDEATSPARSEAATAIKEQLRKIGIDVTVTTGKRSDVGSRMDDGNFQLALVSYNLSEMPHLAFLFASTGNYNFAGYRSETMDGYLMSAYTARTEEELVAAMARVQAQITQDLPMFGLFFRTGALVSKKGIDGITAIREGQALRGLEIATLE